MTAPLPVGLYYRCPKCAGKVSNYDPPPYCPYCYEPLAETEWQMCSEEGER